MNDVRPPTISVALGTHNGAAYLGQQLTSILNQTMLPAEIVLSDDASIDDTIALAERVVGGAVPLIVIRNRVALGVTGNFEQAALACSGELIALCDQDDIWVPERLALMAAEFASRPDLTLMHSDARLVDSASASLGHTLFEALEVTNDEKNLVHSGRGIEALLRRNLATGATMMFRRSPLEAAIPFPRAWVHDEWLAIIAALTGEIDMLETELIDYRQHGANQIGVTRLSFAGKVRRVMEPRRARNERLATNFGILESRVQAMVDIDPALLELVQQKAQHEYFRRALPEARILRVVPVLRQVVTGKYRRFSRARGDILRDLVQPVD
ncbi:glycosyltransferase family 2 protein [Salinibacterium sp.]|uniref:glycosyltransferase family 2 protein n=1 Tax=Salinibacterium sp. TaxID=1915057 RepID=UPI00286A07FE|nr:glycosyltransferase family 2 protein [Salinibacterium sp.]